MGVSGHNAAYMTGVVLGAVVVAAALLWTPLSGREARTLLGSLPGWGQR